MNMTIMMITRTILLAQLIVQNPSAILERMNRIMLQK